MEADSRRMSKESRFFIYLIERYAEYKNTTAEKVLQKWEEENLVDFIYEFIKYLIVALLTSLVHLYILTITLLKISGKSLTL